LVEQKHTVAVAAAGAEGYKVSAGEVMLLEGVEVDVGEDVDIVYDDWFFEREVLCGVLYGSAGVEQQSAFVANAQAADLGGFRVLDVCSELFCKVVYVDNAMAYASIGESALGYME
jgi:hypothetical protein